MKSPLVYRSHYVGASKRTAYFLSERKLLVYERNAVAAMFNGSFARWRHFNTRTRIPYAFPFIFKFGNPGED